MQHQAARSIRYAECMCNKCQKRPNKCQKRPNKCQKRPNKCQKRPNKTFNTVRRMQSVQPPHCTFGTSKYTRTFYFILFFLRSLVNLRQSYAGALTFQRECVCVRVCVYVCIYVYDVLCDVCMYVCMYICMYVFMHACMLYLVAKF